MARANSNGLDPVEPARRRHLARPPPEVDAEPEAQPVGGRAGSLEQVGRRADGHVRRHDGRDPTVGLAVPGLRELDGLAELGLAEGGIVTVAVVAETVHLDVEGHDPHEAPDSEPLDERRVDVGVLFHLEHGRHAAPQELRVGERADGQALLARDDGGHREVLAGDAAEPRILGPAAEQRVADVVVGADEPGDDHLAAPIEDPRRGRMAPQDLVARADVDDARALHVDGAGIEDAMPGIDRDDRRVADEDAHGRLFDLRRRTSGTRWTAGIGWGREPGAAEERHAGLADAR